MRLRKVSMSNDLSFPVIISMVYDSNQDPEYTNYLLSEIRQNSQSYSG